MQRVLTRAVSVRKKGELELSLEGEGKESSSLTEGRACLRA